MTYKQLKWFILLIPTITVGLWEYVRHEYLLPYISMDLGNWLTPIIVLFVTFTLLTRFFTKLERIQEELKTERAEKAVLEERERIARNLHDGMAQSLFLLSIKIRLHQLEVAEKDRELFEELNQNILHIHDYVRHGIKNLKLPPNTLDLPWLEIINKKIAEFESESGIKIDKTIDINEQLLSAKEKVELISCLSEALVNIRKHAHATKVTVHFIITHKDKFVKVIDNGRGFERKDIEKRGCYGLQMMRDRCNRINWSMDLIRKDGQTIVYFSPSS